MISYDFTLSKTVTQIAEFAIQHLHPSKISSSIPALVFILIWDSFVDSKETLFG